MAAISVTDWLFCPASMAHGLIRLRWASAEAFAKRASETHSVHSTEVGALAVQLKLPVTLPVNCEQALVMACCWADCESAAKATSQTVCPLNFTQTRQRVSN